MKLNIILTITIIISSLLLVTSDKNNINNKKLALLEPYDVAYNVCLSSINEPNGNLYAECNDLLEWLNCALITRSLKNKDISISLKMICGTDWFYHESEQSSEQSLLLSRYYELIYLVNKVLKSEFVSTRLDVVSNILHALNYLVY